jgi:catechol 2,3-dioxygenase-like lactoylglutathione lyase family enzyme
MTPAAIPSIAPFFIIRDVAPSIAFYRDRLGFEVAYLAPVDDPANPPFFAIVRRGGAQLFMKAVQEVVGPVPNRQRHPWARWDAYVDAPDPEALAAELESRGVSFCLPLGDTEDGLRGFEVQDPDGYVLFFGRSIKG